MKSCLGLKWLGTRVLQLFGPNQFSSQGSHGLFHPLRVLLDNIIVRHPRHCSSSFQQMFTTSVCHSLTHPSVVLDPVYIEWGTPVYWGRFLLFCVPQSVKTKETNPTRPGSPTPCKQALSLLRSWDFWLSQSSVHFHAPRAEQLNLLWAV